MRSSDDVIAFLQVIDDLGSNDLGWSQIMHGFRPPTTKTPTIDGLAFSGTVGLASVSFLHAVHNLDLILYYITNVLSCIAMVAPTSSSFRRSVI